MVRAALWRNSSFVIFYVWLLSEGTTMQGDERNSGVDEEVTVPRSSSSALVTDQGRRVLLRVASRFYELTQDELRKILGLPDGPPGLGITVDRGRLRFEFATDKQSVVL